MELDSRADTDCCGATWKLHSTTGEVVDVSGFHDDLDSLQDIPIGTAKTAVALESGTHILVAHQALHFDVSLQHSLAPPAQLWDHGLTVDIVPKQYSDGRSLFGLHDPDSDSFIPFSLHGCISYVPTRLPTDKELEECPEIVLTSDAEWRPYDT